VKRGKTMKKCQRAWELGVLL